MSEEPTTYPEVGPFQPFVQQATGPGTGPDWKSRLPAASLRRIRASATTEEAGVQATTEAVIVLHSIRRILMWSLVITPGFAAAAVIGLFLILSAA
ncbi:hypothetical protein ACFWN2_05000 [Lentzea sp. NPDC058436]|uniref:hypothetical protein n=1 Tax=Lentzea sp. NPDC058436 TaxID=3346499 RepID=UPI00365BFDAA